MRVITVASGTNNRLNVFEREERLLQKGIKLSI